MLVAMRARGASRWARALLMVLAVAPPIVAWDAPSTSVAQDAPVVSLGEPDALRVRIAERVRGGDATTALAMLDGLTPAERSRPDVRVVRAWLAAEVDRHDVVADALVDADTTLPPELRAWAHEARGRALLFLGRADDAERELAPLDVRGASSRARALRAEAAVARGDLEAAEARLTPLVRDDPADVDTFALRTMWAELLRARGQTERSEQLLRALLVARPGHPDATTTEALLASWLGASSVPWSFDERIARANHLVESHLASRALVELEPLPRPTEDDALRAWLAARATALYESREGYLEASQLYAESAERFGNARHRFLAARALLRADREREGLRALRAFVRDEPRHASATEAEWLIAMTELRGGRVREGRRALEAFVRGPRGRRSRRLRREAEWHLGLIAFDAGRGVDAANAFRAWGEGAEGAMERGRALYWEGRAAASGRDASRAERSFRAAIAADPLGWYALWSARRLRELGVDPGPPLADAAPPEATYAPLTEPPLVTFYASLGLDALATDALRDAERARGGVPGSRRALVERFLALGDVTRAYRLAGASALLAQRPRGEAAWVWQAGYPRPFESDVVAAASRHGIAPELVYAVMRQESAFDPRVVSYADAIGLMQLLPSTAARYAERVGMPFGREVLYRPGPNVELGAAYLAVLERDVGVPLCFAAYNAGEHRVHAWLEAARRDGGRELDRFVEDIPFEQTRAYIRRVTSSYAHYLYARDPAAGWPSLELPLRVGEPEPRRR